MYTFFQNRSPILEQLLLSSSWRKAEVGEEADFSMWDTFEESPRDARIALLPRSETDCIGSKWYLSRYLLTRDREYLQPRTFLYPERIRARDIEPERLYFIKETGSTGGDGILCVRGDKLLETIAGLKGEMRHVIQENVERPQLIDGSKFTLRVYVLMSADKIVFVHREVLGILHGLPYDSSKSDHSIHVSHRKAERFRFRETSFFEKSFPMIKRSVYLTLSAYFPWLNCEKKAHAYQLFGFDYMINEFGRVFLIEVNTYPNLHRTQAVDGRIKRQLFEDLLRLVVYPALKGTPPKTGDFEAVYPLLKG